VTFIAASKFLMKLEAARSFELWQSFAKTARVRNSYNWEFVVTAGWTDRVLQGEHGRTSFAICEQMAVSNRLACAAT